MIDPTIAEHLDIESILWLEEWLAGEYKGALVMTSHDRDFMNRIVNKTVEVAGGTITTYGGNYDFYLREREIRREQLLASHRRQQEMMAIMVTSPIMWPHLKTAPVVFRSYQINYQTILQISSCSAISTIG